ncbi:putative polysaccharide biosynthesis protein [Cladochytrium replicatum]|nr:putative polysaccharide biosynthesis protein [Cladochytrium replicatum]
MDINAENYGNHPDIEKQWAVKAFHHAETYFNLITNIDGKTLKLTKIDDELYRTVKDMFPHLDVTCIDEMKDFKSNAAKEQWRSFLTMFDRQVMDYNFGTLLRVRSNEDYGPDNSFFVTRLQFYAIEVVRNRDGHNSTHHKPKPKAK